MLDRIRAMVVQLGMFAITCSGVRVHVGICAASQQQQQCNKNVGVCAACPQLNIVSTIVNARWLDSLDYMRNTNPTTTDG